MVIEFNVAKANFLKLYNKLFFSDVELLNYIKHEHIDLDNFSTNNELFFNFDAYNIDTINFKAMNDGLKYLHGKTKI